MGPGKQRLFVEAIAWVLFDHHKGAESWRTHPVTGQPAAQVQVEMISSRDQRTYRIKRCTRSGYNIYDPKLAKLFPTLELSDEVLPMATCQHLDRRELI
jgi:hypothetical protein